MADDLCSILEMGADIGDRHDHGYLWHRAPPQYSAVQRRELPPASAFVSARLPYAGREITHTHGTLPPSKEVMTFALHDILAPKQSTCVARHLSHTRSCACREGRLWKVTLNIVTEDYSFPLLN